MTKTTWTLDELRTACMAYDAEQGCFPESEYEGRALFSYLIGIERSLDDLSTWQADEVWATDVRRVRRALAEDQP